MLALIFSGLGFSLAKFRTMNQQAPMLVKKMGPTGVKGRVLTTSHLPKGLHLVLDKVRINGLNPAKTPEKIRLKLLGNQPDIDIGSWVSAYAVVSPPAPPVQPGAFDFQRFSYFKGIGGIGFTIGEVTVIARSDGQGFMYGLWLAQIRQKIAARIRQALPGNTGAIAQALMTGEKKAIDEVSLQNMRDSGLAHLLAISGLHIGLVAGMLFISLRAVLALVPYLALHYPIKKWAAFFALIGAFAYTQIAGATIPTQRAFMMVGLVFVAILLDRRGISMRTVALAAFVILFLQPESLLSPSFQMSFAAVIALVAGYELIDQKWANRLRPWARDRGLLGTVLLYILGVGLTTLIAGTATAPIALYHFNQVASYGLAANLLAVPLAALWVMPWAMVSFALMPLGLEGLALVPMGAGIDFILKIAGVVARWPEAVHVLPAMPTAGLVMVIIGGLWLCLWQKSKRYLGIAGIALGGLSVFMATPPDILIDGDGRLIGVKGQVGNEGIMLVSSNKAGRFERDIWLKRAGLMQTSLWPRAGLSPHDAGLQCDHMGCFYEKSGLKAALVQQPGALLEDCWQADVLISLIPVRQDCPVPVVVVDRFDLWQKGAHAIWLGKSGVRVKNVRDERGQRPWVVDPAKKTSAALSNGKSY